MCNLCFLLQSERNLSLVKQTVVFFGSQAANCLDILCGRFVRSAAVDANLPLCLLMAQSCRATKRLPTAGFDPQRSFPVHWKSSISASVAIKSHFLKIYGIFHIVGDGDE